MATEKSINARGLPHVRLQGLRKLLEEQGAKGEIVRILETHNGLTGILAETASAKRPDGTEVSFHGMWSSSLTASATKGKPDIEQVDTSARLGLVRDTLDVTSKPMIYDADTGGLAEIFRYTVRELESMGVSACIIEDKTGLKQNSLFGTERKQVLADPQEFGHKIAAGVKAKRTNEFMVIARLESLIAGYGVDDAIMRAEVYLKAGADGIMIHSKDKDTTEIFEFMKRFQDFFLDANGPFYGQPKVPLVLVPTSYNHCTEEQLAERGANICIYANHMLRAAYPSMKNVAEQILINSRSEECDKILLPVKQVITLIDSNPLNPDAKPPPTPPTAVDMLAKEPIDCAGFCEAIRTAGINFFCGVPDSLLAPLLQHMSGEFPSDSHIITANEGAAIGVAAGHYMASGDVPLVYMQNSGLGNIVNPVMSMAHKDVYGFPMVLLVGWRGCPGHKDEPQHITQGKKTLEMLKSMGIECHILPMNQRQAEDMVINATNQARDQQQPVCLLVPPKTFAGIKNNVQVPESGLTRESAIETVIGQCDENTAIVGTTGYTSREIYEVREKLGQGHGADFLCVGSMGHALAIAQGVAVAKPNRSVVCLDGDGACLMHMGTMTLSKTMNCTNLVHILMNNKVHDSVGAQPIGCSQGPDEDGAKTTVHDLDFAQIALNVGYKSATTVSSEKELLAIIKQLDHTDGPHFIDVKLILGTRPDLGRPKHSTFEAKNLFMEYLSDEAKC